MAETETSLGASPIIAPGYVSGYTGPEIDNGITRANEMWYTRIEAEEVNDPISAVQGA